MRSSSLRVYSPVEYTGYKEKRSGHPSEPGSRTGNRKTTRKPSLFYTGCAVFASV